MHKLFDFKRHNSFQNKIIEEPHRVLQPQQNLWFLICNKNFENSMISALLELSKSWPPRDKFLNLD